MNQSLRFRLIVAITATTVVVLLGTTLLLYSQIHSSLYAEFDEHLGAKARALTVMIEQDGNLIDVEFDEHQIQEYGRSIRPEFYQLWAADGTVLARSRRLGDEDLPQVEGSSVAPGIVSLMLPDGRDGRLAGIQFLPHVDADLQDATSLTAKTDDDDDTLEHADFARRAHLTLVVARDTADVERTLTRVVWLLSGCTLLAVVAIVGVLAWLVTRSLQPLDQLASQIEGIDANSLTERVHIDEAPSELRPAVRHLNELITRLETAFQREKTFAADVAHELRTPLSGMRSTLEVSLSRRRENQDYQAAMGKCLGICDQTQDIVETLLSLSRLEAGRERPEIAEIDVDTVLQDCWAPFDTHAHERGLDLQWDCETGVVLSTDPAMLRVVFCNLMDNAVSYTNTQGTIRITTFLAESEFRLRFTNTGCTLSLLDAERVFERFWRADSARSQTGQHAGLGLALSRRMIEVMGGTTAVSVEGGHFSISLAFNRHMVRIKDVSRDKGRHGHAIAMETA